MTDQRFKEILKEIRSLGNELNAAWAAKMGADAELKQDIFITDLFDTVIEIQFAKYKNVKSQ